MRDDAMGEGPPVLVRRDGGVARLMLDRPAQLNALSEELLFRLREELGRLSGDNGLRAVVLSGNGRAFCAGHDLKEMLAADDIDAHRALFQLCSQVMQAIVELPVPVIAKVHGVATAAGCQLVASCDLAIAGQSARFATSGINAGLFCSTPAVALSRNVAAKRAFEMLVTGEFIDAARAADWGLVNAAVPDEALDAAVDKLLASILDKSSAAIRHGKALFNRQRGLSLADAYGHASEVMACNMMEADAREGISAFIEKRRPVWQS
ncbi:enoyl-CoA hydratase [Aureimonas altamirensis]|uniref:enoyl-CoA hydratase n=1 Tax=Aureimonas altamirensis TaxID=370622 RepID=UPI002036BF67|nr:enoyl-CoA hydratase [Aureimonas altamirensis]MCM2502174.1 enoyl-CoA hydratase [Aureimonas altamirensis]